MSASEKITLKLFAGLLCGAVLGVWLAGRSASVRESQAPHDSSEGERVAADPDSAPAARVPLAGSGRIAEPASATPGAAVEPSTAGAYLAQYYGAQWPEIQAKIEAAGCRLDVPYHCTPWEECAGEFEKAIAFTPAKFEGIASVNVDWPETLTPSWIQQNYTFGHAYTLGDEDLPALEQVTAEKNLELRGLGEQYATLVDMHVQDAWRRGTYLKAPYTTMGLSAERGFHSESHAGHGWSIVITLKREDCPDVAEIEDEMSVLRGERDALVVEYLRTKVTH